MRDAALVELEGEVAPRLLARADHDRVDVQYARLAVDTDVQPGVVDTLVGDAAQHAHAALAQQRAPDPSVVLARPSPTFVVLR
jgi:hypothetical protein